MNKVDRLVVIIVPIYKEDLDKEEQISLCQLYKILGHYPIIFIMPRRLESLYKRRGYSNIVCFSDAHFASVKSYSRLLLMKNFYKRFLCYKYMLIYQLDAFVFSDQLVKFCRLDYDYIGAPWPRWVNVHGLSGCRVGNGGFSLRKISSSLRILDDKKSIMNSRVDMKQIFYDAEDVFWGYCGALNSIDFKVPNIKTALSFSIEHDVGHCYNKLSCQELFGCHNWISFSYAIWKPIIERYGYVLRERSVKPNFLDLRKTGIQHYLFSRFLRKDRAEEKKALILKIIDVKKNYSIWGCGRDGIRCLSLLKTMNVNLEHIYDRDSHKSKVCGYQVDFPDVNNLQNYGGTIIISTKKYEKEILTYLLNIGYRDGVNILFFSIIESKIVSDYYGAGWRKED